MATFAMTSMAQSNNVPKPLNPTVDEYIDGVPYIHEGDGQWKFNTELGITWGQDVMGNLVADDYNIGIDTCWTPGPCQYTMLDPDKFSFSVYTDFDKIYTFTTEKYTELTETTTMVPFSVTRIQEWGGTNPHFEPWFIHFVEETNNGEEYGFPRFFKWRIGLQTHYTVDGVTNSSDIVYWDVNKWGDLNNDGDVNVIDITELIDIIMNSEDNSLADLNDDGDVNVIDITALIDAIMNEPPF